MADATSITAAYAATYREIAAHDAEALSRALKPYANLGVAIAALRNDDCFDLYNKALTYEAALAEIADPDRLAKRLRRDVEFHRAHAADYRKDAAELEPRRDWASVRDVPESLAQLERRIRTHIDCAEACDRLAAQAEGRANAIGVFDIDQTGRAA